MNKKFGKKIIITAAGISMIASASATANTASDSQGKGMSKPVTENNKNKKGKFAQNKDFYKNGLKKINGCDDFITTNLDNMPGGVSFYGNAIFKGIIDSYGISDNFKISDEESYKCPRTTFLVNLKVSEDVINALKNGKSLIPLIYLEVGGFSIGAFVNPSQKITSDDLDKIFVKGVDPVSKSVKTLKITSSDADDLIGATDNESPVYIIPFDFFGSNSEFFDFSEFNSKNLKVYVGLIPEKDSGVFNDISSGGMMPLSLVVKYLDMNKITFTGVNVTFKDFENVTVDNKTYETGELIDTTLYPSKVDGELNYECETLENPISNNGIISEVKNGTQKNYKVTEIDTECHPWFKFGDKYYDNGSVIEDTVYAKNDNPYCTILIVMLHWILPH